jgi:hypothetical protein
MIALQHGGTGGYQMSARIVMRWPATVQAFRLLYVAFIVVASATTLTSAWTEMHATGHQFPNPTLLVALASVEIVAAVLFIFPRIEIFAGIALLIVFAVAEVLSIMDEEVTLRFFFYAGTVLFILAAVRRE